MASPIATSAVRRSAGREPTVAVEGADVDVRLSRFDAARPPAEREVGVDERADVLVARIAAAPELVELVKDRARHLERSPDPRRRDLRVLDANLEDLVLSVRQ